MSKTRKGAKANRATVTPIKKQKTAAQIAADAQKALEKENKAREKACWDEIQRVLEAHGCEIYAQPVTVPTGGGAFALTAGFRVQVKPVQLPEE